MGHGCGPRARRAGGCLAAPVEQTQPKFPSRGGNPLHRHRLSIDRVASRRRRYRPICFFFGPKLGSSGGGHRPLIHRPSPVHWLRRLELGRQEQNVFDGAAGALVVHQVAWLQWSVTRHGERGRTAHTAGAAGAGHTCSCQLICLQIRSFGGRDATEVPCLLLPNAYTSCLVVGERERCASDRLVRLTAAAKLVVKPTLGTRSCLQFTGLRCACSGRRNCC